MWILCLFLNNYCFLHRCFSPIFFILIKEYWIYLLHQWKFGHIFLLMEMLQTSGSCVISVQTEHHRSSVIVIFDKFHFAFETSFVLERDPFGTSVHIRRASFNVKNNGNEKVALLKPANFGIGCETYWIKIGTRNYQIMYLYLFIFYIC